jgi:hypothetical protein
MVRTHGMMGGFLLICVLLVGMPQPGSAAISDIFRAKDAYSDVSDALHDADTARDRYYQNRSGRDSDRYEREWRNSEYKLEEARVQRMAREAKVSPDEVRKMREDGRSWDDISKRHRVDSRKMGYGHKGPHGYDRDRDQDMQRHFYKDKHKDKHKHQDKHKGDHPGKAKGHYKGTPGGPPGQYKK